MTQLSVKLLVNRFDDVPVAKEIEVSAGDTVAAIKERHFAEDVQNDRKIRIIHGGNPLRDSAVLSGLRGYQAGEPLVLTVFVTQPATPTQAAAEAGPANDYWKWSTSAWILVVATLWCYKLKFRDSFRRFPVLVLYVATFFCVKMIVMRFIRGGRSRPSG